ncbi:MAG TPA: hypothetical protein VEL28_12480 [Candidatus Binatia bacterium]|nr:hypothetical protein [Candidatus Binatia bacterium]
MRALRRVVAVAAACAVLLCASVAPATFTRTEEDDLLLLLRTEQVAEGRAGFERLFDSRIDKARTALRQHEGTDAIEAASAWVVVAARALEIWQAGEMSRLQSGAGVPEEVYASVLARAETLHALTAQLRQSGDARGAPRANDDGTLTSLQQSQIKTHEALLDAVAFTRSRVPETERARLLSMARGLGAAPPSIDAFDAAHPDAARYLQVAPAEPPGNRTPRRERVRAAEELAPAVRPLVESYYQALFAGSRAELETVLAPQHELGALLDAVIAAHQGRQLRGLGRIDVRRIGEAELEVTVDGIEVVEGNGSAASLRDTLVVARQDDGSYRVAFPGSAAERSARP